MYKILTNNDMKRVLSAIMAFLTLSSMVFVSCDKDGDNGESGKTEKTCYFKAKVQISQDLLDACETLSFEYNDADGKKVKTIVDASKLKAAKFPNPTNDQDIDVLEWSCSFDYKNYPAEVYFKPTMQIKENVSFEKEPDFIFYPMISSGVHDVKVVTNCNSVNLKLGVMLEGVSTILNTLSRTINGIEVDTTIE